MTEKPETVVEASPFSDAPPRSLLLVVPSMSQGGAERQILELARRLAGEFKVTLCTLYEDNHYDSSGMGAFRRMELGL